MAAESSGARSVAASCRTVGQQRFGEVERVQQVADGGGFPPEVISASTAPSSPFIAPPAASTPSSVRAAKVFADIALQGEHTDAGHSG